jgi:hypothetical protein
MYDIYMFHLECSCAVEIVPLFDGADDVFRIDRAKELIRRFYRFFGGPWRLRRIHSASSYWHNCCSCALSQVMPVF